jgi:hypothetical protein
MTVSRLVIGHLVPASGPFSAPRAVPSGVLFTGASARPQERAQADQKRDREDRARMEALVEALDGWEASTTDDGELDRIHAIRVRFGLAVRAPAAEDAASHQR